MPRAGDRFITRVKRSHLEWGSHRHTATRDIRYGEGYLKIPASVAYALNITNNNAAAGAAEFDFSTADGYINGAKLLASGNQHRPDFAKQLHGSGALRLLGNWFAHIGAVPGDDIEVSFVSPSRILLTKL